MENRELFRGDRVCNSQIYLLTLFYFVIHPIEISEIAGDSHNDPALLDVSGWALRAT